jgi:hypothetical protein
MARPQVADGEDGFQIRRVAANILRHSDPLLGNDRETNKTTAIARQTKSYISFEVYG